MELKEIIDGIRRTLDEADSAREEALRLTREVVRLSGDAVKAIHRNDLETARQRLKSAQQLVEMIRESLKPYPMLYYSGYVQSAHQEFVEATLLLAYREGREFPSPWDLGVPEADYLLGLGDFVGELRRHFLLLLIDGKVEEAEEVYRFMEELYGELMTLEYPKGLVNIRTKQDQARHILERTLEDLTRAKLNKRLEEKLKAAVGDE
ncbi:DNA-binding protein translin homolog [Thermococcus kodakarensis KOD1]|uniref:DNA-binding protein translin homolog n=1 Tax=Thermococcus kodakarensis (strain ATCC BAA-918 / JCM 12380 / KOD1) TaxID=69014 RepID=Q5JI46_THEKO|nr:haloacid dehalogenase [Thermococcus kodakarensis]WCN28899.1 haloacid dehalogenase [Thermococcus kodakarensis]WCN31201.1 haloacid dehalogenase [Thermococcus kodakarensis]BAD85096.1 DNA-binding protein translin homolog [Thermococcus kodakarensis KOD1]